MSIIDSYNFGLSTYHKKKNQILQWCPADTEELFKKNLKQISKKDLLEKNNWIGKEITYKFNEHGYRSDSFNLPCKVLFAGCSQTMGIGLSLDLLWSSRIAEYLDVPYHSIACGGADWQHNTQRIYYWLPKLKPEILVLKCPPSNRFNWWDQETVVSTCQFDEKELLDCKVNESRPLIDIIDKKNSWWYEYSMIQLIEKICKDHDTKLITIPTGRINYNADYKVDLARDLMHYGKDEQNYVFEVVKRKINEL